MPEMHVTMENCSTTLAGFIGVTCECYLFNLWYVVIRKIMSTGYACFKDLSINIS